MGKVDETENAIDHCVTNGDQTIERPQGQGIEKVLEKHVQAHDACLVCEKIAEYRTLDDSGNSVRKSIFGGSWLCFPEQRHRGTNVPLYS